MLKATYNQSLQKLNTFGLDVRADTYCAYDTVKDLIELIKSSQLNDKPCLIMGGGSNLLFVSDFKGIVLHSKVGGIEVVEDNGEEVLVRVGAGVEWDALVEWCVENGLWGIENLSLIPGSVGASPVQNIGAYGVELKDVLDKVEGVFLHDGKMVSFVRTECQFDYRYSIFKGPLKNKVVITHVYLRLSRKPDFQLNYGNVREAVEQLGGPTLVNIRKAVVEIRRAKLPDPLLTGNAGSFFKNPVITVESYHALQNKYSEIPSYSTDIVGWVKVPAGWLIEKAGWKGKKMGKAGVHTQQALVLVNYGGATGQDILNLAKHIENDVKQLFGIELEREVNVVGGTGRE